MNKGKLVTAIRALSARTYRRAATDDELRDAAELLCVLARVLDGKPIEKAFGAPGDWGYGTPIGDALAGK